ncbi:ectoine/hydroxyectoine ABC transporter permease subunit EhuC [Microvirga sp. VF16]|uniref:ectoine/hydroxyectoine ABC transporter permease subunit EhuC n=1 Tax=Microvirga sp. VF16 TaxID=2807101 RepID=UPI00193E39DB|nr:ectoine/hydroxyectoine ABC transporter permease subunit EhuC [Microvirga sp. VF16]QRM33351.1 ectoine/hydroxyectoine ABC transporter permease subunit EhuC [Microvirga sp. VF16]
MPLWDLAFEYWPQLLSGTIVTVEQFLLASVLTIVISVIFGLGRLSDNLIARGASIGYIEFFRGTSLLVQLYWIFYVLPVFGISLDKFSAGFVAIALNSGAYGAELVRGGIKSVPKGQWEAAFALSMSPLKRMFRIILPQAMVMILPSWGNLLIEVLKATALVSLIAVADLMYESQAINLNTYLSAQAFGTALIIYYVLARFILTPAVRLLESKLRLKLSRH